MPAKRDQERASELKLKKLLEANARLKQQLDMERIPVSEASQDLINFTLETHDTLLPSIWGTLDKKDDPYAPVGGGCACLMASRASVEGEQEDYYELLGIGYDASEREINQAYRKLALKWHPDKNPSTEATVKFVSLQRALQILTDPVSKAAHDAVIKARLVKRKRTLAMSAERKRLKDELEYREKMAAEVAAAASKAAEASKAEEDDREEEMERKEQLVNETKKEDEWKKEMEFAVKVRWKDKEVWEKEAIQKWFSRYGIIDHLILSTSAKRAIISFATLEAAHRAVSSGGTGLQVSWASGKTPTVMMQPLEQVKDCSTYESLTLIKLRQKQREKMEQELRKREANLGEN